MIVLSLAFCGWLHFYLEWRPKWSRPILLQPLYYFTELGSLFLQCGLEHFVQVKGDNSGIFEIKVESEGVRI